MDPLTQTVDPQMYQLRNVKINGIITLLIQIIGVEINIRISNALAVSREPELLQGH
jgi:hypothetical protein